jgi:hypothetical protein
VTEVVERPASGVARSPAPTANQGRLAGLAAAGVALLLRAPFLVVVGAAVVVTALLRLTGVS